MASLKPSRSACLCRVGEARADSVLVKAGDLSMGKVVRDWLGAMLVIPSLAMVV